MITYEITLFTLGKVTEVFYREFDSKVDADYFCKYYSEDDNLYIRLQTHQRLKTNKNSPERLCWSFGALVFPRCNYLEKLVSLFILFFLM